MTRSVTRRARHAPNVCRKCLAPMVPLSMPRIGVRWLTKGDCCGACHFAWARAGAA